MHSIRNFWAIVLLFFYQSLQIAYSSEWSQTSWQFLRGSNYKLGKNQRTIFSFEHASGSKLGDQFFFFDIENPNVNGTSLYGEWSPNFSFNKITNSHFKMGAIRDIGIVANLELG